MQRFALQTVAAHKVCQIMGPNFPQGALRAENCGPLQDPLCLDRP